MGLALDSVHIASWELIAERGTMLRRKLAGLRAMGVRVVLVEYPVHTLVETSAHQSLIRRESQRIAREMGVPFVSLKASADPSTTDGVHLAPAAVNEVQGDLQKLCDAGQLAHTR